MSNSDVTAEPCVDLRALTDDVKAATQAYAHTISPASQADLAALLGCVARLYSACSTNPYGSEALSALDLTTTDACTVAAVMLRSQSLTPFEFAIWFTSGQVGGGA